MTNIYINHNQYPAFFSSSLSIKNRIIDKNTIEEIDVQHSEDELIIFNNYLSQQTDHDDEYYCSCNSCPKCNERINKLNKLINQFINKYQIENVYLWNNKDGIFEKNESALTQLF